MVSSSMNYYCRVHHKFKVPTRYELEATGIGGNVFLTLVIEKDEESGLWQEPVINIHRASVNIYHVDSMVATVESARKLLCVLYELKETNSTVIWPSWIYPDQKNWLENIKANIIYDAGV